jgi:hypothetical protein
MRNLYFSVFILLLATAVSGQIMPGESTPVPARPTQATRTQSSGKHLKTASTASGDYQAISAGERLRWFAQSTAGPESLTAGLFSAGFGTAIDRPREYGPHWDGFGKRYAMRLTGVSTGNAIEAGLGAVWGEDPRYFRAAGQPIKRRLENVMVMTFAARQRDGNLGPAYARYLGNAGNNFLSNSWRADSESGTGDACIRILLGFAGKMGSNAFAEFWPDARKLIFHRKR